MPLCLLCDLQTASSARMRCIVSPCCRRVLKMGSTVRPLSAADDMQYINKAEIPVQVVLVTARGATAMGDRVGTELPSQ